MTPALCLVHPARTEAPLRPVERPRLRTHAAIADVAARQAIRAWRVQQRVV